ADLYVRFGAQPTTTTYNCRPYLTGSNETCDLTVPSGQTQAYIGVRGYSSATSSYNLTVTWTGP
ncbi:MAG: PPC domain-containing protein, partial [Myxococcales bacterium]|nr:PPC domain-containing protein [Myxococcales bacterium]